MMRANLSSTEYDDAFLDFMIEEDEQMEENVKNNDYSSSHNMSLGQFGQCL
jgi:hypothetical protein